MESLSGSSRLIRGGVTVTGELVVVGAAGTGGRSGDDALPGKRGMYDMDERRDGFGFAESVVMSASGSYASFPTPACARRTPNNEDKGNRDQDKDDSGNN